MRTKKNEPKKNDIPDNTLFNEMIERDEIKKMKKEIESISSRLSDVSTHIVNLITRFDQHYRFLRDDYEPKWLKELRFLTENPLKINDDGIKVVLKEFTELMNKFQKGTWAVNPENVYTAIKELEKITKNHPSELMYFNLTEHLKVIKRSIENIKVDVIVQSHPAALCSSSEQEKFLNSLISDYEDVLSIRTSNCANSLNIKTWREIFDKKPKELLGYRNFGKKSVVELQNIFKRHQLVWE